MSETHINAYAMELQEKKAQLSALQGEVSRLEKIVNPVEDMVVEEPKDELLEDEDER